MSTSATGALLDVLALPPALRLLSIRHIAAGRDGTLAAALQWQGSELEAPPLLAVHRAGAAGLETLAAEAAVQRRTRNYAGSVAVTRRRAAGGDHRRRAAELMLVFDLATRRGGRGGRGDRHLRRGGGGLAGFACSTGEGLFLTRGTAAAGSDVVRLPDLAFDNHLIRI